uniref:ECSIT N-terminal domain-containing protein n=1 Tax=Pavo cristatus TaxID=9049 RepID=A0A8C9LG08_PAVCR
MPALGVARQRDAYNRLLRLLPRGPWVPRGPLQRLFAPFPRQQECGLQVLEQMERYGVVPDAETRFLLLAIFGPRSRPVRKCQRMLYWLPRMRHANPYPLPAQLPPPGLDAACLGLRRIANDPDARLSVYQVGGRPCQVEGAERGQGGALGGAAAQPCLPFSTLQASRVQNSRSCWPGTAQSAPSLWRDRSHCGCAAPACSTTCCGGTLSPPTCG